METRDQDTPVRLAEAAKHRGLTISALRTEAQRGRLTIWRVAGKDWTSLSEIDRMFALSRVAPKAPIYGLEDHEESARLALDAALLRAKKLKESKQ